MSRLVVLDTNILVSAGINALGPSAEIVIKVIEGQLIMVTCPSIVSEYWDVFLRPKFMQFGFPPSWLKSLLRLAHHTLADPKPTSCLVSDPDDAVFYDLAEQFGAVLITGNLKDFPQDRQNPVSVMSPKEFLQDFD